MLIDFSMPGGMGLPGVHGGGDGGAGLVGVLDGVLTAITDFLDGKSGGSGGGPDGPLAGILALGANIHPMVVHFPIAFIVAFFLLEIAGVAMQRQVWRQWASGMLYCGAIGAVLAVAAGLVAEDRVPHGAAVHEIMEWHERLGITVAVLTVGMAIWRAVAKENLAGMAQALHFFLAGLIVTCLVFGTDLGGLMVYQYGVGVKGLQSADEHHHHEGGKDEAAAGSTAAPEPVIAAPQAATASPSVSVVPPVAPTQGIAPEQTADEHRHPHHHHHH
ncbi:Uncharacterized membrane protein [Methylomagnum ishizawai]|uniref:Uncharacterized membrane protein n=1 Tax=Methylomagnum ishizawai TaxID=1760988 RepID=A0A1Y6CZY2_9GAMM|nr:DUF2231 domain-containing protein [Methylomagnum ishizawai]SMF95760.1 Uncharacterized membrane protein [Methylomagnum ishizawai]